MTIGERNDLVEEIHQAIQAKNGNGIVMKVIQWAGLCVSVSTLAIFLWRGGALANTLERTVADQAILSDKVRILESGSTAGAREYMALDTAREAAVEARLRRVEDVLMTLPAMTADLAVLRVQMTDALAIIKAIHKAP